MLVFCGLMTLALRSNAQSILHTTWKTYYLPITDSITVSFAADSMTVTTSKGAALLQSTFRQSNNLITLRDYGGENMCSDTAGSYYVRIMTDTLILILNRDDCDARGGTLMAKRWIRVPEPAPTAPAKKVKKRGSSM
jgi:hypothetical protein